MSQADEVIRTEQLTKRYPGDTGARQLTSRAYLTFVAIAQDGSRVPVPPLIIETDGQSASQIAEQILSSLPRDQSSQ